MSHLLRLKSHLSAKAKFCLDVNRESLEVVRMEETISLTALFLAAQMSIGFGASPLLMDKFDLKLALSPKALEKIKTSGETITIAAYYFGDPKKGYKLHLNPEGQIDLGDQKKIIPGEAVVSLGGIKVNAKVLKHIEGEEPSLLTSIFTSHTKFPDNLLDCDLFQDKVSVAVKTRIEIKCKLIGE